MSVEFRPKGRESVKGLQAQVLHGRRQLVS